MVGSVVEVSPGGGVIIEVRNAFNQGDYLEVIPFKGAPFTLNTLEIMDLSLNALTRTKPSTLVRLPYQENIEVHNLVRSKGLK